MSEDVGSFGERVRKARDASGMSQRAFAELVGIDRSALARLESGNRDPRLSEALAVADALGIWIGAPIGTGITRYHVWMNKIEKLLLTSRESARAAFIECLMLSEQFDEDLAAVARSEGAVGESMDEIFLRDLRTLAKQLQDPESEPLGLFVQQEVQGEWEIGLSEAITDAASGGLFNVVEE